MKPDWDKLMKEYAGAAGVLIGDVDCTAAGKSLCDANDVKGFPTIKYGDPNNLVKYEGGRTFDALSKFAKENLGPSCGPEHPDLCDETKKALLDKFMAMPVSELAAEVKKMEEEEAKVEKDLEQLLKSLQKQYEEGTKAKDTKKEAIKEGGLGLMKSVAAARKEKGEL